MKERFEQLVPLCECAWSCISSVALKDADKRGWLSYSTIDVSLEAQSLKVY